MANRHRLICFSKEESKFIESARVGRDALRKLPRERKSISRREGHRCDGERIEVLAHAASVRLTSDTTTKLCATVPHHSCVLVEPVDVAQHEALAQRPRRHRQG